MKVQAATNFRENLKLEMMSRGLSLRDMGKKLDKPHSYFQKILNGEITPGLDNCDLIADALGMPLKKLLENPKVLTKSA